MGTLRNIVCGLLLGASSLAFGLEEKLDINQVDPKPETLKFTTRGQARIPLLNIPINFDREVRGYVISKSGEPLELFLPIPGFGAIGLDSTEYHMKVEVDSIHSSERTFKGTYCISRPVDFSYEERGKDALYLLAKFLLLQDETGSEKIKAEYPLALSSGDSLYMGDGFHFGRIRERADSNGLYWEVYSQKIPGAVKDRSITLSYSKKNGKLSFQGATAKVFRIFPVRVNCDILCQLKLTASLRTHC